MCTAGMHHDLVMRFIETQTLLLAPICPHLTEHMWGLLGHEESIMTARWPDSGPVDETLVKASQYIMDAAHDFRVRLKALLTPKKNKPAPEKPTHGSIWVARSYPPWQSLILTTLRQLHQENKGFPDNKVIS